MIFNHDPPVCADCWDCGGPNHCGTQCNALVANKVGGRIPVISVFSHLLVFVHKMSPPSTAYVYGSGEVLGSVQVEELPTEELWVGEMWVRGGAARRGLCVDKKNPHTGVIVKMSNSGPKFNCSLAVSVICNSNGVQGPQALERLGACDYVTELKHPSGCAVIINVHGGGLGWFGTLMIIVLCLFAAYLLAGIVYRIFFLGIRGVDIIPNLDFWVSLPRKIQSLCSSLVRRFKGPSESYRSSYSPVNF
ncbi:uncharacterized protein HKW66_Vig0059870 [Vigna angularis]|uniref:Uncharacterized protein n=1 Tax=Phaseolus angularis TaxID=3914 RepID=A0A8T0L1Y6_PHAAN|nr:uncharacterized protein HKW66_Vig0059870 [Vigna angularis]